MNDNINNLNYDYDLIIIGAGPAGMTAAIYAQRASLKTLLLEKGLPGGKMTKTSEIENYPGIDFVTGLDLSTKMQEQVEKLKIEIAYDEVQQVTNDNNGFLKTISLVSGKKLTAKAIIIATGCLEKKLGIPGEDKYYGRGVSYCGVCDGFLFKNQVITVVGGGYAACEESLYLTRIAKQVNLIHRRDKFRADEKTVHHVSGHENIKMYLNQVVTEVLGDGEKVTGMVLENTKTKEKIEVATDAFFPYIGADPITGFVKDLDILDEAGYIIVDDICQTKVKGIFAAGDVIQKKLRQIVTATNDGAIAAQFVINYIEDLAD